MTIVNPSFDEYAQFFVSTSQDLLCRYPAKKFMFSKLNGDKWRRMLYRSSYFAARISKKLRLPRTIVDVIELTDGEFYVLDDAPEARGRLRRSAVSFVAGLQFRDISGIAQYADSIRAFFTPVSAHKKNVESCIRAARTRCNLLVGIHIRRGDYATHGGGRYLYEVADFVRIMKQIEHLFDDKSVGFLVCSNEKLQRNLFDGLNCHFSNNPAIEDMYCLAACDYLVGPPSTFSLWACFYGSVPLYFIQEAYEPVTHEKFLDYFSIVGGHKVHTDENVKQYVVINGAKYSLKYPTEKQYLSL